jgi:hypothetical protein
VLLARIRMKVSGDEIAVLSNGTTSLLRVSAVVLAGIGCACLIAFLATDPRPLTERYRAFRGPRGERDHRKYRMAMLRVAASQKAVALGAGPSERQPRATWEEERRNAVRSLVELARSDSALLRQAATGEQVESGARDLLFDAARDLM